MQNVLQILAQVVGPDGVSVAQLGVAGLMGTLWWWERRYSREREEQLTAAHGAILGQREHLTALLDALEGNTAVISHFTEVQEEMLRVLHEREATQRTEPRTSLNPDLF